MALLRRAHAFTFLFKITWRFDRASKRACHTVNLHPSLTCVNVLQPTAVFLPQFSPPGFILLIKQSTPSGVLPCSNSSHPTEKEPCWFFFLCCSEKMIKLLVEDNLVELETPMCSCVCMLF